MLSTEEKKQRLEDLLTRVRRNRGHLGQIIAAVEEEQEFLEMQSPLPSSTDHLPLRRIPRALEIAGAEPAVVAVPKPAPKPVFFPEPEPESEPVAAAIPEPKPIVFREPEPAPKSKPAPIAVAMPEPKPKLAPVAVAMPEPKPKPAPVAVLLEETRIFETTVQVSSPIGAVHGQVDREWTLHAMLKRAWRVGKTDVDEA